MWHVTCDMWQCPEDFEQKDNLLNEWMNEIMMKVFIEQPRLHGVCSKNYLSDLSKARVSTPFLPWCLQLTQA